MKATRNSTDSFVDIVSNTTGIVIILTLMASVLGEWSSQEIDQDRRRLSELREEIRQLQDLRRALPDLIAAAEEEQAAAQMEIAGLNQRYTNLRRELDELRARQAEVLRDIEALEKLAQVDASTLQERLAQADERLEQLSASLSQDEVAAIEAASLVELQGRKDTQEEALREIERDLRRLAEESLAAGAELQALEESLQALVDEREALQRDRRPHIALPHPTRSRRVGGQPLWVECFSDDGGTPRVRLVSSQSYQREIDGWHPQEPGESLSELAAGEGVWSMLDLSHQDGRPERYFYAVVRPDGIEAFHALREWTHERDWWIEWAPFPAGDVIPLRQRGDEP